MESLAAVGILVRPCTRCRCPFFSGMGTWEKHLDLLRSSFIQTAFVRWARFILSPVAAAQRGRICPTTCISGTHNRPSARYRIPQVAAAWILAGDGFHVCQQPKLFFAASVESSSLCRGDPFEKGPRRGNGRLMAELMIGPATMVGSGLFAACLFWVSGLILITRESDSYVQLVPELWHAALLAFGFQLPLACGLTLVIALIPALSLLRNYGLPRMGNTSTGTRRADFLLQVPVTLQIAFCIGTCIMSGMIVSSVLSTMRETLGYDPNHLAVVIIAPTSNTITFTVGSKASFPTVSSLENLIEQITAIAGVRNASYSSNTPFDEPMRTLTLQRIDNLSPIPRTVNEMLVSPEYFQTMGTRIVRGRGFSSSHLTGGANEIVINEALAKEL